MAGPQGISAPRGVYGIQGVADSANTPGGLFGCTGWIDSTNALWLFGGGGLDGSGNTGTLNDLWRWGP